MWTFVQKTGQLYAASGELVATGYAGKGEGRNNPALQSVHSVGPLPVGNYHIGHPIVSAHMGTFVLPLTPHPSNQMFKRSGFFIHGDSGQHPGEASDGCVVVPYASRVRISQNNDPWLVVVSGTGNGTPVALKPADKEHTHVE